VLQENLGLLIAFAVEDGYSDNEIIETEADSIIDFSNVNPFGMP
jgi:hypothetical protein